MSSSELSPTPSPSRSELSLGSRGKESSRSVTPSLSSSLSALSPNPSMSVSVVSSSSYANWSQAVVSGVHPGLSNAKPGVVSVTPCQYSSKENDELLSAPHADQKVQNCSSKAMKSSGVGQTLWLLLVGSVAIVVSILVVVGTAHR